jgi:TolA-binding protein
MTSARRRPNPAVAALAAALALATVAAPVAAGVFDQDAIKRVDATDQRLGQIQHDLDARLAAIEQQLKSQGLADLFNQLEQLKADVARLRGQIEVLANDVDQQQKRQRDLYVDLDTRLRKLETVPPPPAAPDAGQPPAPGSPAAALPPTPAEQKAYDAALDQFKRADYTGAITGFGAFVRQYPQ